MFCTECGKELPDGVRFCPVCGHSFADAEGTNTATPVAQEATPSAGEAAAVATTSPEPAPKKRKVAQIVVASVVAVVAVLGIGVFAYLQFFSGTPVDEEYFPDEQFRSFVASNIDTDGDGKLTAQEIEQATVVDLTSQSGIADVTGVAVFTNMESFNLGANTVAEVDLSQNTHVAQVSTGAGSAEDLKLPSGFDIQAGLDGAAGTKVEAGDVTVQAGEWTSDNNGEFGPMQRYNGVLYTGMLRYSQSNIEIDGSTPFFGKTDKFHYSNGKVYWIDYVPGRNVSATAALYVSNVDGSDKKTLAQDVLSSSKIFEVNGYIFYSVSYTTPTSFAYINTTTGESKHLPSDVVGFIGPCNNRLAVTIQTPAQKKSPDETLAFFDPTTEELTALPSGEVSVVGSTFAASDAGILAFIGSGTSADDIGSTLYAPDGAKIWSGKPYLEGNFRGAMLYPPAIMDKTAYYIVYPSGGNLDYTLETVNLATSEHTCTNFALSGLSASDAPETGFGYALPVFKDANDIYINLTNVQNQTQFVYRVSLEDGSSDLVLKAAYM